MSDKQGKTPDRKGGQPTELDQMSRRTAGQDTYQSDDSRHENSDQTRAGQHGNRQQANTGGSQSGESQGGRTRVDERTGVQQGNWNEPGRGGNLQSEDAQHASHRGGNTTQDGQHKGSLQSGGQTQGNMQSEGRGQQAQPAGTQNADDRLDRDDPRRLRGRTEQPGIGNKYDSDDERQ